MKYGQSTKTDNIGYTRRRQTKHCTRLAAARDKVYQLLAHGRWISPASSTTNTGRHDIADILLKVALNHQKSINQINQKTFKIIWQSNLLSEPDECCAY
jgi:hypothetical protein